MNNNCPNCSVTIIGKKDYCPLCGGNVNSKQAEELFFPDYESIYEPTKKISTKKILLFLMISIITISIILNIVTYETYPKKWSILVAASLIFAWFSIQNSFLTKAHIGKRIFYSYLSISLFTFVIDFFTGFSRWSINYVIPLAGVASTFFLTVSAIIRRSLWRDDAGYLLVMLLLNILPIIGLLFNITNVVWTSVLSILYATISLIGMFIFADKKFIEELKKRFHL